MEFSLVIELKLIVVDTSYFVGLTPAENNQTQIWESPELNSHQR